MFDVIYERLLNFFKKIQKLKLVENYIFKFVLNFLEFFVTVDLDGIAFLCPEQVSENVPPKIRLHPKFLTFCPKINKKNLMCSMNAPAN